MGHQDQWHSRESSDNHRPTVPYKSPDELAAEDAARQNARLRFELATKQDRHDVTHRRNSPHHLRQRFLPKHVLLGPCLMKGIQLL